MKSLTFEIYNGIVVFKTHKERQKQSFFINGVETIFGKKIQLDPLAHHIQV